MTWCEDLYGMEGDLQVRICTYICMNIYMPIYVQNMYEELVVGVDGS